MSADAIVRFLADPTLQRKADDMVDDLMVKIVRDVHMFTEVAASEGIPRPAFNGILAKHMFIIAFATVQALEMPLPQQEKLLDVARKSAKSLNERAEAHGN